MVNVDLTESKVLTSEFTFGFELEGFVANDSHIWNTIVPYNDGYDDEYGDEYVSLSEETEDVFRYELKNYLDNVFSSNLGKSESNKVSGKSTCHGDGSLSTDSNDDLIFEYSSQIYPCTPIYINSVIKSLAYITSRGIYTNETCGFHHHLKFPNLDERNMVWIYCNMATDPEFNEKFAKYKKYVLYDDDYASYDDLNILGEKIQDENYEGVLAFLNTTKYRVFRIHPQGTLEWRGPRGFLNYGTIAIKEFYILFLHLIEKIKKYIDSDVLFNTNISKKDFFEKLSKVAENRDLEFINDNEYNPQGLNYDTRNKNALMLMKKVIALMEEFIQKPNVFLKLLKEENSIISRIFKSIFKNGSYIVEAAKNLLSTLLQNCMMICTKYGFSTPTEFIELIIQSLKEQGITNQDIYTFLSRNREVLTEYADVSILYNCLKYTKDVYAMSSLLTGLIDKGYPLKISDIEVIIDNNFSTHISSSETDEILKILNHPKFSNAVKQKLFIYYFKVNYIKQSIVYQNQALYKIIKQVFANSEIWNDMIIQMAEHKKEFLYYLTPTVNLKKLLNLMSKYYGDNVNQYLNLEISSILEAHNII
jgi:hypothetical protein